ncbi:50S ribosomal protein L21 [Acetobacteraceae bacterium]|nr:50S ribosomal protein L21 [Candidatus Parcubacteria bacterium]
MEKEFAIIETGGKQYMVSAGDTVKIEKILGDFSEGDTVTFDKVLMVDNGSDTTIGEPYIKGAKVSATVQKIGRAKKVVVIKYKAKSNYFKKRGHRQPFFEVKIDKLV